MLQYLDTVFKRAQVVVICLFDDFKLVGLFHVLDPLVCLTLRIDHKRPAIGTDCDQGIVHRKTTMGYKHSDTIYCNALFVQCYLSDHSAIVGVYSVEAYDQMVIVPY